MKIIISPSKTQNPSRSSYLSDKEIIHLSKHKRILDILKKYNKTELKKIMKIDKKLLDDTYENFKNFANLDTYHAFESFNGLVYKGLAKELYHLEEYEYIEAHLVILDALYGILEPGTLIKKYRLDMKKNIGLNLYSFWNIDNYFEDELVINLASNEFSKMVKLKNYLNISFKQYINNSYVNQATYSKQARGRFLNYLILNQITSIEKMMEFKDLGYSFNSQLSNEYNLIFTRTN